MIKKFPPVWEKMSENCRGDFLTQTVNEDVWESCGSKLIVFFTFNVTLAGTTRTKIMVTYALQINKSWCKNDAQAIFCVSLSLPLAPLANRLSSFSNKRRIWPADKTLFI